MVEGNLEILDPQVGRALGPSGGSLEPITPLDPGGNLKPVPSCLGNERTALRISVAGASVYTCSGHAVGTAVGREGEVSDIYARLGVRCWINAGGYFTRLGGAPVDRDIWEATTEISQGFVDGDVRPLSDVLAEVLAQV